MGVLRPVTATADYEESTVKVHVHPLQAQHLTLTQTEREGDGPPCGVAVLVSSLQQPLYLLDGVGLYLVIPRLRRLGQQHRVLAEMPPPHSLVERGAKGPVHLVSGSGQTCKAAYAGSNPVTASTSLTKQTNGQRPGGSRPVSAGVPNSSLPSTFGFPDLKPNRKTLDTALPSSLATRRELSLVRAFKQPHDVGTGLVLITSTRGIRTYGHWPAFDLNSLLLLACLAHLTIQGLLPAIDPWQP